MNTLALLGILAVLVSCAHVSNSPTEGTPVAATSASNTKPAPLSPAPPPAKVVVRPQTGNSPDTSLHPRGIDFGATIQAVAFGSTANQDLPQPLWKTIAATDPDLFLFMGDSIQSSTPEQKSLKEQYKKLDTVPEYRSFREKVPFMATWDDQDYGPKEFIRYWSYVGNSTGFGQKGIYHSKIIGPKNKQVQIIMLDTRTFRTAGKEGDAEGTLLGETQWDWLESQLKRPAQVRFVVSSIPLVAAKSGADKWANFPKERQRFFDLLKKTRTRNVVVVSGDRRQSSIAKTGVKDWGMLFDVTASPINQPAPAAEEDPSFEGHAVAVESFGLAQIDWKSRQMSLQIRDASNKVLNSISFKVH